MRADDANPEPEDDLTDEPGVGPGFDLRAEIGAERRELDEAEWRGQITGRMEHMASKNFVLYAILTAMAALIGLVIGLVNGISNVARFVAERMVPGPPTP